MIDEESLKIYAPISPHEPYRVMGVGQKNGWWDIGYICSNENGKINKWSRYKPVSLKDISIPDFFNNDTKVWDENPLPTTKKSWIYGDSNRSTYTVPIITKLSDIGSNGVQNDDSEWKYNPPTKGNYVFRLTDFLGYNHQARCPIIVEIQDEIKLNSPFFASVSYNNSEKTMGEFGLDEILNFVYGGSYIYAGIAIRNVTKSRTSVYVQEERLQQKDFSYGGIFVLQPGSGASIKDGGFGQVIAPGDKVEVMIFLSSSPGETSFDMATKFSALVDKKYCKCYISAVAYQQVTVVEVPYVFKNLTSTINTTYGITYYVNEEDFNVGYGANIYSFTRTINALYAKLTVKQTPDSAYMLFNIYLSGEGVVDGEYGYATVRCTPNLIYKSWQNGSFSYGNFNYDLNGVEDMVFDAYESIEDARNRKNAIIMYGCPIYDSVIDHEEDTAYIGKFIRRVVDIRCRAVASTSYKRFSMVSEDDGNLIFKDGAV